MEKTAKGAMNKSEAFFTDLLFTLLPFRREQAMPIVQPACLDLVREEFELPPLTAQVAG